MSGLLGGRFRSVAKRLGAYDRGGAIDILLGMATIFYSMSGEGRGHATRVRAIVEDLRTRHDVTLFAPGQAYTLLGPIYRGTDVGIHPIDGLSFRYRAGGKLDYPGTLLAGLRELRRFPARVDELRRIVALAKPDLVITDFEPLLPRAARKEGVPYISIDHQHFLLECDLSEMPVASRIRAAVMGLFTGAFYSRQKTTVVSSFYRPPLRHRPGKDVRQVGVLLGRDILDAAPSQDDLVLAYLRRDPAPNVLDALESCGHPVRVYGAGAREPRGKVEFLPVDREGFVRDLARCRFLVATAGNQVVGEALHLGKPVLAMPEPGNWEQEINGFWVERMGVGRCLPVAALDARALGGFDAEATRFKDAMRWRIPAGNQDVSRIVEGVLSGLASESRAGFRPVASESVASGVAG